jgi:hypothetical protein
MATAVAEIRPEELRDAARRVAAARRLATVEAELEAAVTRRTELWHDQSVEPDPRIGVEIRRLSAEINKLWAEARARRACIRGGSRERILTRVRAEARFEREAKRKVQGGAR